ncbi:alpha/beta hydrolase [Novosphingobium album (ex Liu et al. 2023)]|uniref:Alpha/beta hydrolase n=1 Tax=Novosphingobium album (ex Liu et al. 2023) TaxID=3031130 RepID=A0ABT5WVT1_9SPHN|nr:alpha/beta hydrolase [Novosphingobium album (ex Liu et al. 2023)]MDE8653954.1 alpha/beta hydrolase [Novosphingobium album (ex Liu et al. 2023)]
MRSPVVFLAMIAALAASPLAAREAVREVAVMTADPDGPGSERFLGDRAPVPEAPIPQGALIPQGIARYGPFRVLDAGHAALVDVTDSASPARFAAMLRDFPGIGEIAMIDCPGTEDDLANLTIGRMIRARGLATRVPAGGSVRSGAVELFLAGARRYAEPGAEFAVHAWMDDTGHEASDYAESDPANAKYLAYYRQMGMSPIEARAFYAMTNSAPFASARWFGAGVMAMWVRLDDRPAG